jgi:hypothetical protein
VGLPTKRQPLPYLQAGLVEFPRCKSCQAVGARSHLLADDGGVDSGKIPISCCIPVETRATHPCGRPSALSAGYDP